MVIGSLISLKLIFEFCGKGAGNHRMEIKDLSEEFHLKSIILLIFCFVLLLLPFTIIGF
jgi:hypothetical protein